MPKKRHGIRVRNDNTACEEEKPLLKKAGRVHAPGKLPEATGIILRILRDTCGYTSSEVAKLSGVSLAVVSRNENDGWLYNGEVSRKLLVFYKETLPEYTYKLYGGTFLEECAEECFKKGKLTDKQLAALDDLVQMEACVISSDQEVDYLNEDEDSDAGLYPEEIFEPCFLSPQTNAIKIVLENEDVPEFFEEVLYHASNLSDEEVEVRRAEFLEQTRLKEDGTTDLVKRRIVPVWGGVRKSPNSPELAKEHQEIRALFRGAKKIYDKYNEKEAVAPGILDDLITSSWERFDAKRSNEDFVVRLHAMPGDLFVEQWAHIFRVIEEAQQVALSPDDQEELRKIKASMYEKALVSARGAFEIGPFKPFNPRKNNEKPTASPK